MKVSKLLLYRNFAILAVSTIIVWLALVKLFPPVLAVWFSCKVNRHLPKKV